MELFAAPLTYRDVPNRLAFLVPPWHILVLRAAPVGNICWFARPAPPAYLLSPHPSSLCMSSLSLYGHLDL